MTVAGILVRSIWFAFNMLAIPELVFYYWT